MKIDFDIKRKYQPLFSQNVLDKNNCVFERNVVVRYDSLRIENYNCSTCVLRTNVVSDGKGVHRLDAGVLLVRPHLQPPGSAV